MIDWSVRMPKNLLDQIIVESKKRNTKETGGYLMGIVYEKRQSILILFTYIPIKSKRTPTLLELGVEGWTDYRKMIEDVSCRQVYYLGDWHSHPNGTIERSHTDIDTFNRIKPKLNNVGVCLITNVSRIVAYIIS